MESRKSFKDWVCFMTNFEYFEYLKTISYLGRIYRRLFVYPQIIKNAYGNILDIGCGIGGLLTYKPEIIGVDINKHCVEHCNQLGLTAFEMLPDVYPSSLRILILLFWITF